MHVDSILRQLCRPCSGAIDARRLRVVVAAAQAIVRAGRLSVTAVGRCIDSSAFPKHSIKRVDRLLSNSRMHREQLRYFQAIATALIGGCMRPVVLLDWTKVTNGFHALAAAVPADGRALTIYEEVHPERKLANPGVEKRFLRRLALVLPAGCRPIIVTDAGFRGPFFHSLQEMGWDFVGRLRSNTRVVPVGGGDWTSIPALYATASERASSLGTFRLFRTRKRLTARLVLIGPRRYGRRHPWRGRSTGRGGLCAKTVQGAKDPWLLVTSLDDDATHIVRVYAKRMQIEETFRDTKNTRFGWCLRHARSHSAGRLSVLLLLAALAMVAVTLVGLAAESMKLHRRYQANTTKTRVLSLFVLGMEVLRRGARVPSRDAIPRGLALLRSLQPYQAL